MYKQIVNPATGRKVNVNGKLGQKVLNNYYNQIGGDGACLKIKNAATGRDITDQVRVEIVHSDTTGTQSSPLPLHAPNNPVRANMVDELEDRRRLAAAHQEAAQAQALQSQVLAAQTAQQQAAQQQAALAVGAIQNQAQAQENDLISRCSQCINKACRKYETKNSIALRELGRLISQQIVNAHSRDFNTIKYLTLCSYNIRDFDLTDARFNPLKALGTFKNIIKSLDNSGCSVRTDLKPLEETIRNIVDIFPNLCKNAHQIQQQQQQGGKRKNNSKNNTKKRKPSRKNNRKRRASKNKRN